MEGSTETGASALAESSLVEGSLAENSLEKASWRMSPPDRSSLGHLPGDEGWVFDEAVANVFPDMLKRSIPQLDVMRQTVFELGCQFVQPGTDIVDLGCSLGDSLAPFISHFGAENRYVGVELSAPMLGKFEARFAEEIAAGWLRARQLDLNRAYLSAQASLTLSILTLQFLPEARRPGLLKEVYETTERGGALIVVEKVLGASVELNGLMVARYHALKNANGYSWPEIEKKRLALQNVLLPLSSRQNEALLRAAGFAEVDCFWRWLNFAGYIAIK